MLPPLIQLPEPQPSPIQEVYADLELSLRLIYTLMTTLAREHEERTQHNTNNASCRVCTMIQHNQSMQRLVFDKVQNKARGV